MGYRTIYPMYELTTAGRAMTWWAWKRKGGCGLANNSVARLALGPEARWAALGITLGQIADADPADGRALARFAATGLGLTIGVEVI
jgi:hypothetical protein